MYGRERKNKSDPKSTIISLLVVALFLLPSEVIAVLIMLAVTVFLIVRKAAKGSGAGSGQKKQKAQAFDDCPRPFFCFHKDKGEHHVKRGREIDPWDRPDIDISKYQRR